MCKHAWPSLLITLLAHTHVTTAWFFLVHMSSCYKKHLFFLRESARWRTVKKKSWPHCVVCFFSFRYSWFLIVPRDFHNYMSCMCCMHVLLLLIFILGKVGCLKNAYPSLYNPHTSIKYWVAHTIYGHDFCSCLKYSAHWKTSFFCKYMCDFVFVFRNHVHYKYVA